RQQGERTVRSMDTKREPSYARPALALAAAALISLTTAGSALAGISLPKAATEGCRVGPGEHCTYTVTRSAGFVASGDSWRVEINHKGQHAVWVPESWTAVAKPHVVVKGDVVSVFAADNIYGCVVPVVDGGFVDVGPGLGR